MYDGMMIYGELSDAVKGLDVLPSCASVVELIATRDLLDAKIAEAVGAVDAGGEWAIDGAVSMTAWIRNACKTSAGGAQVLVKTAARMAVLPVTNAAWQSGALSSAQIGAIVANVSERTVSLFASQEAEIIPELIPLSVRDTAQAMQHWAKHAEAITDPPEERDTRRSLSASAHFGGRVDAHGSFSPELGQVLLTALSLATTKDAETEERTAKERRGDALIDICRFYLDNQQSARGGRHRPHLNLVADVADPDGPGTFIDGTAAPSSFVEAVACDANIHRVLTNGRSAILDYGRSVRSAPPDLFNALALRDGHCREPGCDRPPAWCDAHHVDVWEEGGVTSLANSVLRCSRHHHLWHRRRRAGWREKLHDDATLVTTAPDARTYVSYPQGPLARRQTLGVVAQHKPGSMRSHGDTSRQHHRRLRRRDASRAVLVRGDGAAARRRSERVVRIDRGHGPRPR
jgi:hypothetical protein